VILKPSGIPQFRTAGHDRRGGAAFGLVSRSLAVVALVAFTAPWAAAQDAGNGFLFEQPVGSLTISGGYAHANASGGLFSEVTNDLTLARSDFSGAAFGADFAMRVAPRFDVVLSASYAGTSTPSNYRELVDQNNQEIMQSTEFKRVPLMLSVRAYLQPRGREVGKFAWVPARFAPYVGVGGGAMWYKFRQNGDFVNYQTNNVFTGDLSSSQWTPAAQALGGVDFTLTPHVALNGEVKYIWANAKLNNNFIGFDNIDLSGLSTTLGLTFRF